MDSLGHWKPEPGYPRYEVSDLGGVRNVRTGRVLLAGINPSHGYAIATLWENGSHRQFRVHRLVLMAFVGPAPEGCAGAHLNGVCTDNRLDNLTWATSKENERMKREHGTDHVGERHGCAKLTEADVREIRRSALPGKEVAARYGIAYGYVSHIRNKRRWRHLT